MYLGILRLLNTKLKNISNRELAYKIGADVPFFINGGTARVSGVGEKISKLKYKSNVYIVLVNPDYEISTKWVYK